MPRNESVRRRASFAALVVIVAGVADGVLPRAGVRGAALRAAGWLRRRSRLCSPWPPRAVQPFQDGVSVDQGPAGRQRPEHERWRRELEELRGQVVTLQEAAEENDRLKGLTRVAGGGHLPAGDHISWWPGSSASRPPSGRSGCRSTRVPPTASQLNQPVVGATVPVDGSLSGKGPGGQGGGRVRARRAGAADHRLRSRAWPPWSRGPGPRASWRARSRASS